MEGVEVMSSSVTVKRDDAAVCYPVVARSENQNSSQFVGSPMITAASPVGAVLPGNTEVKEKKKRGRPKKYGPDGVLAKLAVALSPMPISSSVPLIGEFSSWKCSKPQPFESLKKQHKCELESPGKWIAYSVGANFSAHVVTVNAGEDVMMKILSFSQQGSQAICILSANGAISNVTLRQPSSSGGTLTYEGRFELLSLTGSFMPTENGATKSRSGGISVCLAGPDGRVVGGGLAGLLVAAGPIQVVVGSFLPGHHLEQKPKKQRTEYVSVVAPVITASIPREEKEGAQNPDLTSTHRDSWAALNSIPGLTNLAIDNRTTSHREGSKVPTPSNCDVAS